ncbi:hypothetical protein H8356DRAFT_1671226 [Neocallimastix lanati (nom. inval.)]|jgi:hypothetical protein|uniref:Uncharacterized protein n=1 Tax=Neocallimastix californiae TaxID=1754190 RepID=A0A1Y2FE35_9FUNG|nr:hypothetical protein H8356DRAFT_1671226 [Neocallimastix sp. JGI-2020a]ORY82181.1 hypothetical protein LY90DRAFT_697513 [Neocallimastix californiae]|eukprot:ORY82181.1 hypothetical protein LY90DRAFT_697513 [Neocallimastix californiae]
MKIIHSLLLIISLGIITNTSGNSDKNQYDYKATKTDIKNFDVEACIRNSDCGSKSVHFNRRDEDESLGGHRFVSIEINPDKFMPTFHNKHIKNDENSKNKSIPSTTINLHKSTKKSNVKRGPPPQNFDKNIGYNNFNYFNTYKIKPTIVNSTPNDNSNVEGNIPTTVINLNSAKVKRGPPPRNFDKNIGYNNFNYFNTYKIKPTNVDSTPSSNSNNEDSIPTNVIDLNSAKAKRGPPPQNFDKNIGYNNFNYFNTYKIKPTNLAKAKRGPPPQNFDKNIGYNNFNYFNTYKIKPTPTNNSPTNTYYYNTLPVEAKRKREEERT